MRGRESRVAWERRVERWRRSGLSAQRFAAREGVRSATLAWWRWRLGQESPSAETPRRRRNASRAVAPADFVELIPTPAMVGTPGASTDLELELAAGYRVRLSGDFSGEALTRLLDILEARR